jgi:hypothetical protein
LRFSALPASATLAGDGRSIESKSLVRIVRVPT